MPSLCGITIFPIKSLDGCEVAEAAVQDESGAEAIGREQGQPVS